MSDQHRFSEDYSTATKLLSYNNQAKSVQATSKERQVRKSTKRKKSQGASGPSQNA